VLAQQFDLTLQDVYEQSQVISKAPLPPPTPFQRWIAGTFGVTIPARGRDIVTRAPVMADTASGDPFLKWLHAGR
jgi:hypothetical protein